MLISPEDLFYADRDSHCHFTCMHATKQIVISLQIKFYIKSTTLFLNKFIPSPVSYVGICVSQENQPWRI